MQIRTTFRVLAAGALVLVFALLLVAPRATATAQDDPLSRERLKEEVARRHKVGDTDGIVQLLRQNPKGTVQWVYELNDFFSQSPSEERAKEMDMLRNGWRRGYQSDFFDNLELYFSRLNSEMRKQRATLRARFDTLEPEFLRLLQTRDKQSAQRTKEARAVAADFATVAEAFRQVGDLYHVSAALYYAGFLLDEALIATDAEPAMALRHFQGALEARRALALNDIIAADLVKEIDRLTPQVGADGGSPGSPASPPQEEGLAPGALSGVQLGPATASAGKFEAVPKLDTFERFGYSIDELSVLWQMVQTGADGTAERFPGIREGDSPKVRRTGPSAAEVVGTDGQATPIPMTGRMELVRTHAGPANNPIPWAFLARLPSEKERYQGFDVNFAPSPERMTICIAPAAAMRHQVGATSILVLDENLDGVYGGPSNTWNWFGLPEGYYAPEFDAVVVGKARRAVPFSELMDIEGKWYRLEIADGGRTLNWQPATLRTGKVQLDAKGITPHSVIVRGTGTLEHCYFDLAATKGVVELPVGRWQLVSGVVRQGRRMEVTKALFIGDEAKSFVDVTPDGVAKLALGGPFDIVAKVEADETHLRVTGASIAVVGRGGERYARLWGCALRPELSVRKAGTKRSGRPHKVPYALDQSTIDTQGVSAAWHPFDLEIVHGLGGPDVEYQFSEKKHALFGNIESEWR